MSRIYPLAIVASVALVALFLHRCRRAPCLTAHEWPAPCDPRTDELQAWASLYERSVA